MHAFANLATLAFLAFIPPHIPALVEILGSTAVRVACAAHFLFFVALLIKNWEKISSLVVPSAFSFLQPSKDVLTLSVDAAAHPQTTTAALKNWPHRPK
jgi:hypothetical protein